MLCSFSGLAGVVQLELTQGDPTRGRLEENACESGGKVGGTGWMLRYRLPSVPKVPSR